MLLVARCREGILPRLPTGTGDKVTKTLVQVQVQYVSPTPYFPDQTPLPMRVAYDFVEAPMPGVIEGYSEDKYQKLDYQIAASTFLFNQNKNKGYVPEYTNGTKLSHAESKEGGDGVKWMGGDDWLNAAKNYNGGGNPNYADEVKKLFKSATSSETPVKSSSSTSKNSTTPMESNSTATQGKSTPIKG